MPGMSLADAAFNTAHDYPHGGAAALGLRMGKSNLSAEVNPDRADAKLGLLDALKLQKLSGDCRILYAMAAELGHFPPLAMPEGFTDLDQPCMRTLSETAKEFSDVVATTAEALADGSVSDNDLAQVTKEWSELIVKGQALMGQLAAMNARFKARAA